MNRTTIPFILVVTVIVCGLIVFLAPHANGNGPCNPVGGNDPVNRSKCLLRNANIATDHDHLFGVEDFDNMRRGGVVAKTVMLTTDLIDWNLVTQERFNVSALDNWQARFEQHWSELRKAANIAGITIVDTSTSVDDIRKAKAHWTMDDPSSVHTWKGYAIVGSEGILHLQNAFLKNVASGAYGGDWVRALHDAVDYYYKNFQWRQTQIGHAGEANVFVHVLDAPDPDGKNPDTGARAPNSAGAHLSPEGAELICYLNKKGIVIDLEHQALPFVREVTHVSSFPVMYSHDTHQSTTRPSDGTTFGGGIDAYISASIRNSGTLVRQSPVTSAANRQDAHGIFGMHFYRTYYIPLNPDPEGVVSAANGMINEQQIQNPVNAPSAYVALGGDFFGEPPMQEGTNQWAITDLSHMPEIIAKFVDPNVFPHGYPNPFANGAHNNDGDAVINRVLGENLLSFYKLVWQGDPKDNYGCNRKNWWPNQRYSAIAADGNYHKSFDLKNLVTRALNNRTEKRAD